MNVMRQVAWFGIFFSFGFLALQAEETAKKELKLQDQALNRVYQQLKKELEGPLFEIVRSDQRDWLQFRDYMSEGQRGDEEFSDQEAQLKMAAGVTEERVEWLRAWLKSNEKEGLEGRYMDSFGGHLEIAKKDGEYWFQLLVVRGPTFHLGEIGGKLRVNGGSAWFETREEGVEDPTWLTFVTERDGTSRLRIIGENTQFYHGSRAYFDGVYLWTGDLSEKERAAVIAGEETLKP